MADPSVWSEACLRADQERHIKDDKFVSPSAFGSSFQLIYLDDGTESLCSVDVVTKEPGEVKSKLNTRRTQPDTPRPQSKPSGYAEAFRQTSPSSTPTPSEMAGEIAGQLESLDGQSFSYSNNISPHSYPGKPISSAHKAIATSSMNRTPFRDISLNGSANVLRENKQDDQQLIDSPLLPYLSPNLQSRSSQCYDAMPIPTYTSLSSQKTMNSDNHGGENAVLKLEPENKSEIINPKNPPHVAISASVSLEKSNDHESDVSVYLMTQHSACESQEKGPLLTLESGSSLSPTPPTTPEDIAMQAGSTVTPSSSKIVSEDAHGNTDIKLDENVASVCEIISPAAPDTSSPFTPASHDDSEEDDKDVHSDVDRIDVRKHPQSAAKSFKSDENDSIFFEEDSSLSINDRTNLFGTPRPKEKKNKKRFRNSKGQDEKSTPLVTPFQHHSNGPVSSGASDNNDISPYIGGGVEFSANSGIQKQQSSTPLKSPALPPLSAIDFQLLSSKKVPNNDIELKHKTTGTFQEDQFVGVEDEVVKRNEEEDRDQKENIYTEDQEEDCEGEDETEEMSIKYEQCGEEGCKDGEEEEEEEEEAPGAASRSVNHEIGILLEVQEPCQGGELSQLNESKSSTDDTEKSNIADIKGEKNSGMKDQARTVNCLVSSLENQPNQMYLVEKARMKQIEIMERDRLRGIAEQERIYQRSLFDEARMNLGALDTVKGAPQDCMNHINIVDEVQGEIASSNVSESGHSTQSVSSRRRSQWNSIVQAVGDSPNLYHSNIPSATTSPYPESVFSNDNLVSPIKKRISRSSEKTRFKTIDGVKTNQSSSVTDHYSTTLLGTSSTDVLSGPNSTLHLTSTLMPCSVTQGDTDTENEEATRKLNNSAMRLKSKPSEDVSKDKLEDPSYWDVSHYGDDEWSERHNQYKPEVDDTLASHQMVLTSKERSTSVSHDGGLDKLEDSFRYMGAEEELQCAAEEREEITPLSSLSHPIKSSTDPNDNPKTMKRLLSDLNKEEWEEKEDTDETPSEVASKPRVPCALSLSQVEVTHPTIISDEGINLICYAGDESMHSIGLINESSSDMEVHACIRLACGDIPVASENKLLSCFSVSLSTNISTTKKMVSSSAPQTLQCKSRISPGKKISIFVKFSPELDSSQGTLYASLHIQRRLLICNSQSQCSSFSLPIQGVVVNQPQVEFSAHSLVWGSSIGIQSNRVSHGNQEHSGTSEDIVLMNSIVSRSTADSSKTLKIRNIGEESCLVEVF